MTKLSIMAAALLASAASVSAEAATITVSGDFGGVFAGSTFGPQAATFTLQTDEGTGSIFAIRYAASSLVADSTLNGQPFNFVFQGSGYFFDTGFFGLQPSIGQGDETLFSFNRALGTLSTGSTADFQTNAGTVRITSGANITSTVVAGGAAAVPEPATWGLMLLGMGMVGAGLRSRRVRFSAVAA